MTVLRLLYLVFLTLLWKSAISPANTEARPVVQPQGSDTSQSLLQPSQFRMPVSAATRLAKNASSKKDRQRIRLYLKRAERLYNRAEYEAAIVLYAKILKLDENEPSARLKMAKSLYKIARFEDAFRMFRVIGLAQLDPDSSYEYAQSALKSKDFAAALSGFEAIPQGHPLFDLSNYYGAICAANLKRYRKAKDLMKQALVLPSKLVASRKAYMSHFEEMLKRDTEGNTSQDAKSSANDKAAPPGSQPAPSSLTDLANGETKAHASLERWPDSLVPTNRFSMGLAQTEQNLDYNERRSLQQTNGRFFAHLDLSPRIDMSAANDQSSAWLSILKLRLQQKNKDTVISTIAGSTLEEQIERLELAYQSSTAATLFASQIKTGPAWRSQKNLSTHLGAELFSTIQELDRKKSILLGRAFLAVSLDRRPLQIAFEGSYGSSHNNGSQEFSVSELEFQARWFLAKGFRLQGYGRFQQRSYSIANIDGPDWNLRSLIELGYAPSKSVKIFLGAHSDILSGNRLHGLEDLEVLGFDQANSGGQIRLLTNLWPWLELQASAKAENRLVSNLTPDTNESREALANNYASYVSSLDLSLAYSQSF